MGDIERNLKDKKYLEVFQQEKYKKELFKKVITKYGDNIEKIEELLKTEEPLDHRTIDKWKETGELPRKKSYLENLRKTEAYLEACEELVKEKIEEYESQKYYYQKIELDEPLKKAILRTEFESEEDSELDDSNLYKDDEGNLYVQIKLPVRIATDEIEAELQCNNMYKGRKEREERLIDKMIQACSFFHYVKDKDKDNGEVAESSNDSNESDGYKPLTKTWSDEVSKKWSKQTPKKKLIPKKITTLNELFDLSRTNKTIFFDGNDTGQYLVQLEAFLDLHLTSSALSFLFLDLFTFLNEQEKKEIIDEKQYEEELTRKLERLKNSLVVRKLDIELD